MLRNDKARAGTKNSYEVVYTNNDSIYKSTAYLVDTIVLLIKNDGWREMGALWVPRVTFIIGLQRKSVKGVNKYAKIDIS